MINATSNTTDFNWTTWFEGEMPSWTHADTAQFFQQLYEFLGTLLKELDDTARSDSQKLKKSES